MSIAGTQFLACAKELASRVRMPEAHARTIIGRAYYAAYHDCVTWHAALPAPGRLPTNFHGGGAHATLIAWLENPDPSLPKDLRAASEERGLRLRALRSLRNQADYDLDATFDDADARSAIADAVSICHIG